MHQAREEPQAVFKSRKLFLADDQPRKKKSKSPQPSRNVDLKLRLGTAGPLGSATNVMPVEAVGVEGKKPIAEKQASSRETKKPVVQETGAVGEGGIETNVLLKVKVESRKISRSPTVETVEGNDGVTAGVHRQSTRTDLIAGPAQVTNLEKGIASIAEISSGEPQLSAGIQTRRKTRVYTGKKKKRKGVCTAVRDVNFLDCYKVMGAQ